MRFQSKTHEAGQTAHTDADSGHLPTASWHRP